MSFGARFVLALLPQVVLLVLAAVTALLAVLRPRLRADLHRWIACVAMLAAVAACGIELAAMRQQPRGIGLSFWNGGLVVDRFSMFVTVTACVFGLVTALLSDTYVRRIGARAGAYFALLLVAVTATSALASQRELLTFFVALQLVLVACTGTVATLKTDTTAARAAWLLLRDGILASALVLYGIAILIGTTGNDNAAAVAASLAHAPALAAVGVTLVVGGLAFFTAMVPLHRWVCRVAQSLPAVPAGFVVTMLVTAGAVALVRFGVSGLGPGVRVWTALVAAFAAATSLVAGAVALRTTRVTHLVAMCVSAQSAFLLIALLNSGGNGATAGEGTAAFLFALVVFGLAVLGTFAVLSLLQGAGLGDEPGALRGLAQRSPGTGLMLAFALATLAGAPPLAGFLARLFILTSLEDAGYGWLVILALAGAVLTLVAVGRAIASMFAEGGEELPFDVTATPRLGRVTAVMCSLAAVYLTVLAQPLLLLARGGAGPVL